ncbi:MAG: hypothetical protein ACYDBY_02965 [Thermoanaerobaculia bacterium]
MTRTTIAGGAVAAALLILALVFAARHRAVEMDVVPAEPTPAKLSGATSTAITPTSAGEDHPGFLYGRVTTLGGGTWEGRLRWGGNQEAFWGDFFNGRKDENPWVVHVPSERMPRERRPFSIFGIEIDGRKSEAGFVRPFMARFGDIARIEARGGDVRVTLKSGAVFDLDRLEASDFDDGVRVWDARRGEVNLDPSTVRAIELLPAGLSGAAPSRLYGTVRTQHGEFTGFVQWNREKCVGTDELDGRTDAGEQRLRFDSIRSIARRSSDSSLVTLTDGLEIALSGTSEAGDGNRGLYVDDPRFGRVLVSWNAFDRVDFASGGSGPGYGDFPPGGPLAGSVTTRDGRRLAGRLVYDLDESEVTETLDAPAQGVDYTIPFGLIASIVPAGGEEGGTPHAQLTLLGGEERSLERKGDLDEKNAGMLVFVDGQKRPEFVPWPEVARVDLEPPQAFYPPLGAR